MENGMGSQNIGKTIDCVNRNANTCTAGGSYLKAPNKKGPASCDADPSRSSCFLVREFYASEEAVEAKDVGIVVRDRQQRVELILVAEAQVVPGGVQVAGRDRSVAGDLCGRTRFKFGHRNNLPVSVRLEVYDIWTRRGGWIDPPIAVTFKSTLPSSNEMLPLP